MALPDVLKPERRCRFVDLVPIAANQCIMHYLPAAAEFLNSGAHWTLGSPGFVADGASLRSGENISWPVLRCSTETGNESQFGSLYIISSWWTMPHMSARRPCVADELVVRATNVIRWAV